MRIPTIVMCALCFASMTTQTLCSTRFTVKELSVPKGAKGAVAVSVNARGDVAGYSITPQNSTAGRMNNTRAVLWKDGKLIDLHPSSSAADSRAVAINDKGDVLVNAGENNAYLWSQGKFRKIGVLPGYGSAMGFALNNKGQVAGRCTKTSGPQKPFIWTNGQTKALPMSPKYDLAFIFGLSDTGVVLGREEVYETCSYWVLWKQQKINILKMPKGLWLFGMNNKGALTGNYQPTNTNPETATVWQNGKLTRLMTPKGFSSSRGRAINDRGWVAGDAYHGEKCRAVLWMQKEVVDLDSQGRNTRAYGMNNAGTVVGTLADAHGNSRPAVWTMQPGK